MKTAKEMREITMKSRETLLEKKLERISHSILTYAEDGETRYEFSLRIDSLPKAFGEKLALGIKEELVKKGYKVVVKKPSIFFDYKFYKFDIRW